MFSQTTYPSASVELPIKLRNGDLLVEARINGSEPLATTNHVWPETRCPACERPGAVSFEFSSHRRAWYACLGCKAVWMGKRQE